MEIKLADCSPAASSGQADSRQPGEKGEKSEKGKKTVLTTSTI